MKIEIVTPKSTINEDGVDFVSMESIDGSLGILPGHMPLFAELKISALHYKKENRTEVIAVMGGVARVHKDTITIITDDAERSVEIDVLRAHKEKADAEAYLSKKAEIVDMLKAEIQLRKALVRLKVAELSKRI